MEKVSGLKFQLAEYLDEQTMSSREIAELTGKRHANVTQNCELLNEKYKKLSLPLLQESTYIGKNGKTFKEFHLTKMQSRILYVRNYDRIKINRYWDEFETGHNDAPPVDNKTVETPINNNVKQEKKMKKETEMKDAELTNVLTTTSAGEQTMSSREIAELTGKEHKNVYRDCEVLNNYYVKMGMLKVENTPYIHPQNGQQYREFQLTKMQTLDLLTGYRIDLRIKVNRRWEELEKKEQQRQAQPQIDFSNPDTILMLAQNWKAEQDKRIALEKENAIQNQKLKAKTEEAKQQTQVIAGLKPKAALAEKAMNGG